MKISKIKMIISTAIIFLPTLLSLIFSDALSEKIAVHWGLDGQPDGYASPLYFSIFLPAVLSIFQWLCVYITKKTNDSNNQSKKVTELIYWICPAISIFTSIVVYSVALGYEVNIYSLMCIFFSALFFIIGNYMPKCKQNSIMGIKIKWTLTNEENWNATHRFAGKVWFWGGLAYFPLAFLPEKICSVIAISGMLILALIPMMYSYLYYRKQISDGTLRKEDFKLPIASKKARIIGNVSIVFIIAFILIIMFTGDINITHNENSLTIEATYWENITLSYSNIESVEYSETNDPGHRLNGYASARLMLGWFSSEADGNHTRYTYTSCRSTIKIITKDGKRLIINKADETQTKALYDEIIPKLTSSEENK